MPKIKNVLRAYPRLRKDENFSSGYVAHKTLEMLCFLANVRQYNI